MIFYHDKTIFPMPYQFSNIETDEAIQSTLEKCREEFNVRHTTTVEEVKREFEYIYGIDIETWRERKSDESLYTGILKGEITADPKQSLDVLIERTEKEYQMTVLGPAKNDIVRMNVIWWLTQIFKKEEGMDIGTHRRLCLENYRTSIVPDVNLESLRIALLTTTDVSEKASTYLVNKYGELINAKAPDYELIDHDRYVKLFKNKYKVSPEDYYKQNNKSYIREERKERKSIQTKERWRKYKIEKREREEEELKRIVEATVIQIAAVARRPLSDEQYERISQDIIKKNAGKEHVSKFQKMFTEQFYRTYKLKPRQYRKKNKLEATGFLKM